MHKYKKAALKITIICFILLISGWTSTYSKKIFRSSSNNTIEAIKLSSKHTSFAKQNFLNAYNKFIASADDKTIKLKSGKSFIWDDGKNKSFDEKFENADLEDMVSQEYITGVNWSSPPAFEYSPGRIRNEEFLKAIYGNSESEVLKNCVKLNWFGKNILVNKINGAADSLNSIIRELSALPKEMKKYFTVTSGTFCWRNIAGTKLHSMHSFALAIDINTKFSNYWRNSSAKNYVNRIPFDIVNVFEKHGFIWGGKWYHYDTMHFEFRPEFFSKGINENDVSNNF